MTIEVTLPQLGETAEEAEILEWLKEVGDEVRRGDALLEVHTDKITVEVPALESGVLAEIIAEPGAVVTVGEAVARLETSQEKETQEETRSTAQSEAPQPDEKSETSKTTEVQESHTAYNLAGKVRASPSARRLARELEVELEALNGTGPNGRVTSEDVRRAAEAREPRDAESTNKALDRNNTQPSDSSPNIHTFTRTERAAAKATVTAFSEMPHFYVTMRAEATELARRVEGAAGVSVNDALVLACAHALREHPRLNATLSNDGLHLHEQVNIGVITATPEGLVTSVVRDADTLRLEDIHKRVREIRARVAGGRATPEDVSGATFCISNLGMYGVDAFSAIILPPNVAILAVGALREEALIERGALHFGQTLSLSVSADHRALDGVAVALFLGTLRDKLQAPQTLFEASLSRGEV